MQKDYFYSHRSFNTILFLKTPTFNLLIIDWNEKYNQEIDITSWIESPEFTIELDIKFLELIAKNELSSESSSASILSQSDDYANHINVSRMPIFDFMENTFLPEDVEDIERYFLIFI